MQNLVPAAPLKEKIYFHAFSSPKNPPKKPHKTPDDVLLITVIPRVQLRHPAKKNIFSIADMTAEILPGIFSTMLLRTVVARNQQSTSDRHLSGMSAKIQ
jgi:hypothetical protein